MARGTVEVARHLLPIEVEAVVNSVKAYYASVDDDEVVLVDETKDEAAQQVEREEQQTFSV